MVGFQLKINHLREFGQNRTVTYVQGDQKETWFFIIYTPFPQPRMVYICRTTVTELKKCGRSVCITLVQFWFVLRILLNPKFKFFFKKKKKKKTLIKKKLCVAMLQESDFPVVPVVRVSNSSYKFLIHPIDILEWYTQQFRI